MRRRSCEDAWKRVDDTLTPKERKTQILYGTLDGLRRAEGHCWTVEYAADFTHAIIGYLDARTGRLIFLWQPPEG